jgi:hypothetical protein
LTFYGFCEKLPLAMERKEGRGRRPGVLSSQERTSPRGQKESKEHQPLPNVWDVLERREKLDEQRPKQIILNPDGSILPLLPEKLEREEGELNRLSRELREKGTARDKLILELGSYGRIRTQGLSRQEDFQKFRSQIEQMSEEGISQEIRRHERATGATFFSGVGLFDIYKRKDKNPSG